MSVPDEILSKIQKLLSLANSDNEHEAKLATKRANEMLVRYNLTVSQVESRSDYETRESGITYKRMPKYVDEITTLLEQFFFVRIIRNGKAIKRDRWGRDIREFKIKLVGKKLNVEVATYVASYLQTVYPALWADHRKREGIIENDHRARDSFYTGVSMGIADTLSETKFRLEEETGLVLVEDPGLKKALNDITGGKSFGTTSRDDLDPMAVMAGHEQGMKVQIRKPITSETKASNKLLGGGK